MKQGDCIKGRGVDSPRLLECVEKMIFGVRKLVGAKRKSRLRGFRDFLNFRSSYTSIIQVSYQIP